MGGKILALREEFGYRPLLVVREVVVDGQNTRFYGDQVLFPSDGYLGITTYPNFQFDEFLAPWIGVTTAWDQVRLQPFANISEFRKSWPHLPFDLIAEAQLILAGAGQDLLRGWWMEFEGTSIPMFNQPTWWVDSDDESCGTC
jgi:hypothetical protein